MNKNYLLFILCVFTLISTAPVAAKADQAKKSVKEQFETFVKDAEKSKQPCMVHEERVRDYVNHINKNSRQFADVKLAREAIAVLEKGPGTPKAAKKAIVFASKANPKELEGEWFFPGFVTLPSYCAVMPTFIVYRSLLDSAEKLKLSKSEKKQLKKFGLNFAKKEAAGPSAFITSTIAIAIVDLIDQYGLSGKTGAMNMKIKVLQAQSKQVNEKIKGKIEQDKPLNVAANQRLLDEMKTVSELNQQISAVAKEMSAAK